MSSPGAGDGPGWDDLLDEGRCRRPGGRRTAPRHTREDDALVHLHDLPPVDALSWPEAVGWSTLIGLGVLITTSTTRLPWGP